MAIVYVGQTTGNSNNGNNVSLSISGISGIAVGDFVIIAATSFGRAGNEARIGNALSYNQIVDQVNTQRLRVAWKFYASGEGTVTVEGSGNSSDAMAAVAYAFRNTAPSTPIDATATPATGSGSAPNPPSVTPTLNDDVIVCFGNANTNSTASGAPTDYTGLAGTNRTDTNPCGVAAAYRILTGGASQAQDPGAFTWANVTWVAGSIAIKSNPAQDIAPAKYTNTSTYPSGASGATWEMGPVDRSPSLYSNSSTFYSPAYCGPFVANSFDNSNFNGAVVASPGNDPTNVWCAFDGTGLTRTIVAAGPEWIQYRFNGTVGTAGYVHILFPGPIGASGAAQNQVWTVAANLRLVASPNFPYQSCALGINEYNSSDTFLTWNSSSAIPTSTQTRFSHTRTLSDANVAKCNGHYAIQFASSAVVDFTIEISRAQLTKTASEIDFQHTPAETCSANGTVNPDCTGVVDGTPGTWPATGWSADYGSELSSYNVHSQIVGHGTEADGTPYVDWRLWSPSPGVTAGTRGYVTINLITNPWPGGSSRLTVSPNDIIENAIFVKMVSKTGTASSFSYATNFQDSGGTWTHADNDIDFPWYEVQGGVYQWPSGTWQKYVGNGLALPGDAYAYGVIGWSYAAGNIFDITMRIGYPTLRRVARANNQLRNSRLQSGSSAEAPWSHIPNVPDTGMVMDFSYGVENNKHYCDIRLHGNSPVSGGSLWATLGLAGAGFARTFRTQPGQIVAGKLLQKLQSGSYSGGVVTGLKFDSYDLSGGNFAQSSTVNFTATAAWAAATTGNVTMPSAPGGQSAGMTLSFSYNANSAIDITLRIAQPQEELLPLTEWQPHPFEPEIFAEKFSETETFYTAQIEQVGGTQDIAPSLYSNAATTFYDPTIGKTYDIAPSFYSNAATTFYDPTIGKTYDIAPTLYSNSPTIYDPTIGLTYGITPSLYSNEITTFYAPEISTGGPLQNVDVGKFDETYTFYTATFEMGAVDVSPELFSETEDFPIPTIGKGAVDVAPVLFTETSSFYTATFGMGDVDAAPELFTEISDFYSITVGLTYDVAPELFTEISDFYTPTAAVAGALEIDLFTNINVFYDPTILSIYPITVDLITNVPEFYSPAFDLSYDITPSKFTESSTFQDATISATYDIAPGLFANVSEFFVPGFVYNQDIAPELFTNDSQIFVPFYVGWEVIFEAANVPWLYGAMGKKRRKKTRRARLLRYEKDDILSARMRISGVSFEEDERDIQDIRDIMDMMQIIQTMDNHDARR